MLRWQIILLIAIQQLSLKFEPVLEPCSFLRGPLF
jgi:hypothetical protein